MIIESFYLIAKKEILVKRDGARGRSMHVKIGDIFWVTTPKHEQKRTGNVRIARKGKNMAYAYLFSIPQALEYFEIMES